MRLSILTRHMVVSEPAKQVFLDAVSNLSVEKARELVKGQDNACTGLKTCVSSCALFNVPCPILTQQQLPDFMRNTCSPGLQGTMAPIVGDAMSTVGCQCPPRFPPPLSLCDARH